MAKTKWVESKPDAVERRVVCGPIRLCRNLVTKRDYYLLQSNLHRDATWIDLTPKRAQAIVDALIEEKLAKRPPLINCPNCNANDQEDIYICRLCGDDFCGHCGWPAEGKCGLCRETL